MSFHFTYHLCYHPLLSSRLLSSLPLPSPLLSSPLFSSPFALLSTVEPRFNEVPRELENWFVKSRFRYIEVLFFIYFTVTSFL